MRKWLRRLALAAGVLVGLAVVVSVVFPWWVARSRRHLLVDMLQSAQSVRIEEFDDSGKTILTRDLDGAQRQALIGIIPGIVPRGFPMSFKLCFVPHHRIIARSADGSEFEITICFQCDQAMHTGSTVYDMPPSGSATLRKFIEAGLDDMKKRREYCLESAKRERHFLETLRGGCFVVRLSDKTVMCKRRFRSEWTLGGRRDQNVAAERLPTEAERVAAEDEEARRSAHYAWHLEWARRFEQAAAHAWEDAPIESTEPRDRWNPADCRVSNF
jgi:hypothetical protein